jgi:hypothetical protein
MCLVTWKVDGYIDFKFKDNTNHKLEVTFDYTNDLSTINELLRYIYDVIEEVMDYNSDKILDNIEIKFVDDVDNQLSKTCKTPEIVVEEIRKYILEVIKEFNS